MAQQLLQDNFKSFEIKYLKTYWTLYMNPTLVLSFPLGLDS